MVAQGALNQIVGSVFSRVRPDNRLAASSRRKARSGSTPENTRPQNSRTHSETVQNGANGQTLTERPDSASQDVQLDNVGTSEETTERNGTAEMDGIEKQDQPRMSSDTIRPPDTDMNGTTNDPADQVGDTEQASYDSIPTVVEPDLNTENDPNHKDPNHKPNNQKKPEKLTL